MKFLIFLLFPALLFAQTQEQPATYQSLVAKARQAFQNRAYAQASQYYLDAFRAQGDRGFAEDRYAAAQALAQAGQADGALANLNRLREKTTQLEYDELLADTLLAPLHTDARWDTLMAALRPGLPDIARCLRDVNRLDQDLRKTLRDVRSKYGAQSPEMDTLWAKINRQDSLNLLEIKQLLDTYGWLGPQQVGNRGNTTLWLVIQHADLATQEHYLPLMQTAADAGKATCGNLAYLEDRILMRKKQKQLYASQQYIPNGSDTSVYYPVEDPDNLNIRRAGMDLPPLSPEIIEELKKAGGN